MSVISRQTLADLELVTIFFDIDLKWNRHLFRAAANDGGDAFATTMAGLAKAIRTDRRFGINGRMRTEVKVSEMDLKRPEVKPTERVRR